MSCLLFDLISKELYARSFSIKSTCVNNILLQQYLRSPNMSRAVFSEKF